MNAYKVACIGMQHESLNCCRYTEGYDGLQSSCTCMNTVFTPLMKVTVKFVLDDFVLHIRTKINNYHNLQLWLSNMGNSVISMPSYTSRMY